MIAEQLPRQQSREAAGPQIHSGPPHQYYLLQNEGTVPAFILVFQSINKDCYALQPQLFTQHLNDECNVSVNFISVVCVRSGPRAPVSTPCESGGEGLCQSLSQLHLRVHL